MAIDQMPVELMSKAEQLEALLQDVYNVVNFGVSYQNVRELEQFIEYHIATMEQMKRMGEPEDSAIWYGMLEVLKRIGSLKVVAVNKEHVPEGYMWNPGITK